MRSTPPAFSAAALCLALLAGGAARAGEPAGGPPSLFPAAARSPSDANVPLGPSLFPLYEHYLNRAEGTDVKTIGFLYHSEDRLDGSGKSRLLLPLFFWKRYLSPPDGRLYLFPLLFFGRDSPEESFTYFLPLFYFSRSDPKETRRAFFPILPVWMQSKDLVRRIDVHRFLYPFARYTRDESRPDLPESRFRLGLRYVLELFEARSAKDGRAFTALNLFNWRREAESGLPLFRHEIAHAPDGVEEQRTYLFPIFWRFDVADSNYLIAGPFHGYFAGGDIARKYYTPLIWLGEGEGNYRSLAVFPFYDRSTRTDPYLSAFASYPFFDASRYLDPVLNSYVRNWGLFLFLYRNTYLESTGKRIHKVLFPLGRFEVEPDGSAGHRRLLPFYFEDFDGERRYRFAPPFYWNYQTLARGTWDWDFTFCLPTYIGWGAPRDYFATGFPLLWTFRDGPGGLDILIPLGFRTFDSTSSALYSLPYSAVRYPSQSTDSILAGGATWRRFRDLRGEPSGWSVDLLWWLWGASRTSTGASFRLLPPVWYSREGEDRSLLIFPLWYRQRGPLQNGDFFFPVYGRFRTADGRLRKDFYALGSYIRTRETGEGGSVVRSRDDFLWYLLSFQDDLRARMSHQHFLPLGLWRTRSVNVDRTIVGPFWYSHRIQDEEYTRTLRLFLGNLFLSKKVERDVQGPVEQSPAPAATPAGGSGATPPRSSSVIDTSDPDLPAPRRKTLVSEERGVLWPLSNFGRDEAGNPFEWALPFYYHSRNPIEENRSFFPLLYTNRQETRYRLGFFRYFFLFDWESFEGGHRFTAGQLLFDWLSDGTARESRLRFLYPVIETRWNPEGYAYQFTPLIQGSSFERGGEKVSRHGFFPLFWKGSTELHNPDGTYTVDSSHFMLFPLYGQSRKSLRTQHHVLFPFFHFRNSMEGFSFQALPLLFLRRDAGETSFRLWPIHSHEIGEGAGDWWVSKYFWLSKLALRRQSWWYRLDPFLFWASSSARESRVGGLFGLADWHRTSGETGSKKSWRVLPLAYGFSDPRESGAAVFPLHYGRDFGAREIDYATPWRFLFVTNRLRGAGFRHLDLLWKVAEYTDHADRPRFHDFRILHALVVDRSTENSREMALNPIFSYFHDEEERRTQFSVLFSLYRYTKVQGLPQHRLFWIFRF